MRGNPQGRNYHYTRDICIIIMRKGLMCLCMEKRKLGEGLEVLVLSAGGEKTQPQPHLEPEKREDTSNWSFCYLISSSCK